MGRGGRYDTSPWWNSVRKAEGAKPGKQYRANSHPWIVGSFGKEGAINPGEIQRWHVAARKNGENDYTAFGHWTMMDFFARSGDGLVVWPSLNRWTAFAGGTNPATDVSGVAGTASYSGESSGVVRWRGADGRGGRNTTYDGAPVTITADFDAMRMDTTIDLAGRVHEPPGCTAAAGCLQRWREVGPERIRFHDTRINADGTFGGFYTVQADPEFRLDPDNHGQLHAITDPGDSYTHISNPRNAIDGRFYVPDGDNAPGQALGTFTVVADTPDTRADYYRVQGAFGAVKE